MRIQPQPRAPLFSRHAEPQRMLLMVRSQEAARGVAQSRPLAGCHVAVALYARWPRALAAPPARPPRPHARVLSRARSAPRSAARILPTAPWRTGRRWARCDAPCSAASTISSGLPCDSVASRASTAASPVRWRRAHGSTTTPPPMVRLGEGTRRIKRSPDAATIGRVSRNCAQPRSPGGNSSPSSRRTRAGVSEAPRYRSSTALCATGRGALASSPAARPAPSLAASWPGSASTSPRARSPSPRPPDSPRVGRPALPSRPRACAFVGRVLARAGRAAVSRPPGRRGARHPGVCP